MDALARYYTQEKISQLLINKLSTKEPKKILELGIGEGSLSLAAFKRWGEAKYYGVDIDDNSVDNIKKNLPFVEITHQNGLEENIEIKLNVENSSVDIALCNPPYLKHNLTESDKLLFDKVKLSSCKSCKQITTDIVFLARNMMFLRDGCELGIILPDSVLTNHFYYDLRKDLVMNHNVKCIIQLPDKIFYKTEARTHILIIEKNRYSNNKIEISKANSNGEITQSILVDKKDLFQRMDFDFHYWISKQKLETDKGIKLEDFYISLSRGNKTKKYLQSLNVSYFHTTSFSSYGRYIEINSKENDFPSNLTLAGPGDILIARVGKRCIGSVALINKGYIPISDCIYRLRVPEIYLDNTFSSFISEGGQSWFQACSHGVCARLVSKRDMLNFNISLKG